MQKQNLENRKYLREKEVSEIYGINRHTLARQRWGDYGLPYIIQGRKEGTKGPGRPVARAGPGPDAGTRARGR